MMRIAIAGTGGLARLIAHFIDEETAHHVVFLSRTVRPLKYNLDIMFRARVRTFKVDDTISLNLCRVIESQMFIQHLRNEVLTMYVS